MKNKKNRRKKGFWRNHWDEIGLLIGFLIGIYFLFRANNIDLVIVIKNLLHI